MRQVIISTKATLVVDNTLTPGSSEHSQQMSEILQTVQLHAAELPKPRGKHARRMRQAEFMAPPSDSADGKLKLNKSASFCNSCSMH